MDLVLKRRIKQLLQTIDARFVASATVVNRKLKGPIELKQALMKLRQDPDLSPLAKEARLEALETAYFGELG